MHKTYPSALITEKYLRILGFSQNQINIYLKNLTNLQKKIISLHYNEGKLENTLKIMEPRSFFMHLKGFPRIFIQKWIPQRPKGLILCQHGNNVNSDLFIPFGNLAFALNWAVLAIDNIGHGRSGPLRGLYKDPKFIFPVYDLIIKSWRKKYPKSLILLIGESLGCTQIARYVATKNKSSLKNLINGIIFIVPPFLIRKIEFLLNSTLTKTLVKCVGFTVLEFLHYLSFKKPFFTNRYFKSHNSYLPEFVEFDKNDILSNDKFYFEAIAQKIKLIADFEKNATKIDLPTLILQGSRDSILHPSGAFSLYKIIPSKMKKIIIYKNAEHSLFMDKNSQGIYMDIIKWAEKLRKKNQNLLA
ncbi:MAG: alpha/beta fold hydrolase [Promethearchaeota archaeon]